MTLKTLLLLCIALPFVAFSQTKKEQRALEKQELAQHDSTAKSLTPVDGKSIVYILRPTNFGALVRMGVDCDGASIGATHAKTYIYSILSPGKHTLVSKAENKYSLDVDLEPGKIYYIKQKVEMGFAFAETALAVISDEDGKKYLEKCKLSKDNVYSQQ